MLFLPSPRAGRLVVVTGASAGVGRAVAVALGARGDRVALLARGHEGLDAAAREVEAAGGHAWTRVVDVADPEAVETAAEAIESECGEIDAWINVAFARRRHGDLQTEFLAHYYEHRLRPMADYVTGWLPDIATQVRRHRVGGAVNALTKVTPLRALGTRILGLEHRPLPRFAPRSLQEQWGRPQFRSSNSDLGPRVVLWPDTFTNHFTPEVGAAAVRVLRDAGWHVDLPAVSVCCGLTWVSTGQLSVAKKKVRHAVSILAPYVRRGEPIVVLEPSCASVFRSDARELFPTDGDVAAVADATVTLAELLTQHTEDWYRHSIGISWVGKS